MARLPQPSTTSPGFLELTYTAGTITHKVRQRVVAGVDITDPIVMGTEANDWAATLAAVLFDDQNIVSFRVLNPSGIELYTGTFTPTTVGTLPSAGVQAAQSFSHDIVGRGNPGGGLAQGNTRHMWFQSHWPAAFTDARYVFPDPGVYADLRDFLNNSVIIGADIYGSKAIFVSYSNLQFNAHYQKRYGL